MDDLEEVIEETLVNPNVPEVLKEEKVMVYVPIADANHPGIASFNSRDFNNNNGNISLVVNQKKLLTDVNYAKTRADEAWDKADDAQTVANEIDSKAQQALNTANATKQAQQDFETKLNQELADYKESTNSDIQQFKNDTTTIVNNFESMVQEEVTNLENTVNTDINQFKTDTNTSIDEFKTDINEQVTEIRGTANLAKQIAQDALDRVTEGVGSKVNIAGASVAEINFTSDPQTQLNNIEEVIPNQATASNQLADKNFVNSSINAVAAFYITASASGEVFTSEEELRNATVFYSGGQLRVPTQNDYVLVNPANGGASRYIYQGGTYPNGQWEYQFAVNDTPFTAVQLAALNSGITTDLVSKIETNENGLAVLNGEVVKTTGDQSINGNKTFTGTVGLANGNKVDGYLITGTGAGVKISNNITGYKTLIRMRYDEDDTKGNIVYDPTTDTFTI